MAAIEAHRRAEPEDVLLPPHRCVVVVHGLGRRARAETLREVGDPLADFAGECLSDDRQAHVEVDPHPTSKHGAWSLIRFVRRADPNFGAETERIWLREAWWPGDVLKPTYRPVLRWLLPMWWSQIQAIARGLRATAEAGSGGPEPGSGDSLYAVAAPSRAARLYEVALGILLATLFTVGAPVVLAGVLLAWLIQGMPGLLGLPGSSRAAAHLLDRLCVGHLSSLHAYLSSRQTRLAIRRSVEAAIAPSLAPGHGRSCAGLTIVAHSWESVAVLDALLGLARRPDLEHPALTFVTVGAALNRAWQSRRRDLLWQRLGDLRDWLSRIRWINVWSRFDPVPGGPLRPDLRDHLHHQGATVLEHRVVNRDDPTADHADYWQNRTEFQAVIAHEILGHPHPPDPGVSQRLAARAERRRWVLDLVAFRLVAIGWAAALGLAALGGDAETARWSALFLVSALGLVVLNAVEASIRPLAIAIVLILTVLAGGLVAATDGWVVRWTTARFDSLPFATRVLLDLGLLLGLYKSLSHLVLGPRIDDPAPPAAVAPASPKPNVARPRLRVAIRMRTVRLRPAAIRMRAPWPQPATALRRAGRRARDGWGRALDRPSTLAGAALEWTTGMASIAAELADVWLALLGEWTETGLRGAAQWASGLARRARAWRREAPPSEAAYRL